MRVNTLANNSIGEVHMGANLRTNIGGIEDTDKHGGGQEGLIGIIKIRRCEVGTARKGISGM